MNEVQRAVLDLEAAWAHRPQHDGRKARVVAEGLGLNEVRYAQVLRALLARPEAWAAQPHVLRAVAERVEAHRKSGRGRGEAREAVGYMDAPERGR